MYVPVLTSAPPLRGALREDRTYIDSPIKNRLETGTRNWAAKRKRSGIDSPGG
jgi:hypothetical protein